MRLFGHRLTVPAAIGMAIVAINIIAAVGAPILAPFPEADVVGDAWADADPTYWLGLDNLGRDIFSRLLFGARMSIGLSLVITCLSFTIGIVTGFAAAIAKGWVDIVLSRTVDLLLAMPTLIFAFVVLSVLGTHPFLDEPKLSAATTDIILARWIEHTDAEPLGQHHRHKVTSQLPLPDISG